MKKIVISALLITSILTRTFDFGAHMIPHPDKAHRGGEDAFFASQDVLAVADGVGGWAQQGIDPADFARKLCTNVRDQYPQNRSHYLSTPKSLIRYAQQHDHHLGSATFVVLTLDPFSPLLKASYIGDSGYAIFRYQNSELKLLTLFEQQQHSFNFPFQLARPDLKEGDSPQLAIEKQMRIEEKDIVVVGSDGLFDNVEVEEMRRELEANIDRETGVLRNKKELAESLAKRAIQYGQDEEYDSPFSQHARSLGYEFIGGKLDDTTVIIAQIKEDVEQTPTHNEIRQTEPPRIPIPQPEVGQLYNQQPLEASGQPKQSTDNSEPVQQAPDSSQTAQSPEPQQPPTSSQTDL